MQNKKPLSPQEEEELKLEALFLANLLPYKYRLHANHNPFGYRTLNLNTNPDSYQGMLKEIEKSLGNNEAQYSIPSKRSLRDLIMDKKVRRSSYDSLHIYVHNSVRQIFLDWLKFSNYTLKLDELDESQCTEILELFETFKRTSSVKKKEPSLQSEESFHNKKFPQSSEILELSIDSPRNGETVLRTPLVKGNVSNGVQEIWLVVKPCNTIHHFVQEKAFIQKDGSWFAQIYVGSIEAGSIGFPFEVRAVANPLTTLTSGELLSEWPEGEFVSAIVTVIRG